MKRWSIGRSEVSQSSERSISRRYRRGAGSLGPGHVRHRDLVVETHFIDVKTRLHVVDGAPVLHGDDSSGGETLTVANSVDFVEDRRGRIARAQNYECSECTRPRSTVRPAAIRA